MSIKKINLNISIFKKCKFKLTRLLNLTNINFYNSNNYDDYYNYYDDNYNNNYRSYDNFDNPEIKPRKKGFTWTLMGSIIGSLVVGGAIAGTAIYLINKYGKENSQQSVSLYIDPFYQQDKSQDSIDAMRYIFSRTISVQFLYASNTQASTISGTAWIFNKDLTSGKYYLATNLHVAAGATYSNKKFVENGEVVDFTNLSLVSTYIGFLNDNSSTPLYQSKKLNMLRVPNPKIVYTATTDEDKDGFGAQSSYGKLKTNQENTYASVDFSVLEFDFNKSKLDEYNLDNDTGNIGNVGTFETWLRNYDSNPTAFYQTPVDDIQKSDSNFNKYLYMGGFPGTNNIKNGNRYKYSYSQNGAYYLNWGGTSWASFAKFPLAYNNQTIDNKNVILHSQSNIYKANYNNYAGVGYTNFSKGPNSGITYFGENSNIAKNYVNVGYYALLDANSLAGSSGSMIITKDEKTNKFEVIGIYWGQISFNDRTSVGVGNFLNIKGWSNGSYYNGYNAPSYNLVQYANDKIKKTNPSVRFQNDLSY